jgi:hypothetical protein
MKNLSRRDFLKSASAACGLALLRSANSSPSTKREAISNIRWAWDRSGVYWTAELYEDGKRIAVTGNYYCVNDDGFRPDIRAEEHDMLERYELLDGDTGIKTIGELPIGSVLDLPEMDDFIGIARSNDGDLSTIYYNAVKMWGKVRIVTPSGEQWRTVNWDGEQGKLWVRC